MNSSSSDSSALFTHALKATGRILLFRAGPEDFPFDSGTLLTRSCIAFGLIANLVFALVVMPPVPALISAAVVVAALALSIRWALRMRKLENRYQQTFNALLVTTSVQTLLLTPLFAQLAPPMRALLDAMEQHPDARETWPQDVPAAASLLFDILFIWMVGVSLRIFRKACDVGWIGSIGTGLLCLFAMLLLTLIASPIVSILGH